MGNCCNKDTRQESTCNFVFLTRSVSLTQLSNEVQLNQQGISAEVLNAVKRAESRNRSNPVNMHEIWRGFELNSSLHSNKFKAVMLDLFK